MNSSSAGKEELAPSSPFALFAPIKGKLIIVLLLAGLRAIATVVQLGTVVYVAAKFTGSSRFSVRN